MKWNVNLRFGQVELFPPTLSIDFMKWKKLWIGISLCLSIFSILVILIKGINWSIDFTGGVEISLVMKDNKILEREKLVKLTEKHKQNIGDVEITAVSAIGKELGNAYTIRVQHIGDDSKTFDKANILVKELKADYGDNGIDFSYTNISGKVGGEEVRRGIIAVLLSLVSILMYVGFRFDTRFAPGAVICLFHDVLIALGFMTFLGKSFSSVSIAAFLTIIGYSVSDTIIVYDRIRETTMLNPRMSIIDVINKSINQTMSRTVLTQVTVIVALLVMILMGGGQIKDFALTMLFGIIIGSYSSIYVAAPLTMVIDGFAKKFGIEIKDYSKKKVAKDPNYIPPVIIRNKKQ